MVFFTDLDNTLIYSHRKEYKFEKIWIEELNGKNQSFITKKTYDFLKDLSGMEIIPVTTRTYVQYKRLNRLIEGLKIQHAIICNGAILIINGKVDELWREETIELCKEASSELDMLYDIYIKKGMEEQIVDERPFFIYLKTDDAESEFENSKKIAGKHIQVYRDKRKVYFMPNKLTKGNALKRYISRYGIEKCLAAGDSEFDSSMFLEADYGFCPETLNEKIQKVYSCEGFFSDSFCQKLKYVTDEEV